MRTVNRKGVATEEWLIKSGRPHNEALDIAVGNLAVLHGALRSHFDLDTAAALAHKDYIPAPELMPAVIPKQKQEIENATPEQEAPALPVRRKRPRYRSRKRGDQWTA